MITSKQSKEIRYNLSLVLTFGKLLQGKLTNKIEKVMRNRAYKNE